MSLFKYSIILITLLISNYVSASFSDKECLTSSFATEVRHKGKPFGLTENVLNIDKQACVLTISHEHLKYMKKKWVIDVCREPVHIKEDAGNINVFKREKGCKESRSGKFCKTFSKIKEYIQDDGLIFADGGKSDISSAHGQVYCSFLLVKKYLGDGLVFSKDADYEGVLSREGITIKKEATDLAPINQNDGPADF
jgi:hypothetical protein